MCKWSSKWIIGTHRGCHLTAGNLMHLSLPMNKFRSFAWHFCNSLWTNIAHIGYNVNLTYSPHAVSIASAVIGAGGFSCNNLDGTGPCFELGCSAFTINGPWPFHSNPSKFSITFIWETWNSTKVMEA